MAVKISRELENELLDKSCTGDKRAFDRLISHYLPYMYNIAAKFTDYPEDTEEVVQEALIKMWTNLKKFKREARLSTWCYIITLNCSRNHLSSRHKIPTHPHNQKVMYNQVHDDGEVENLSESASDDEFQFHKTFGIDEASPEDIILAEQVAQIILEEAENMSDVLSETWFLREIELMKYNEISELKDIPIGTCKSQLFNARNRLDELVRARLGLEQSEERFNIAD